MRATLRTTGNIAGHAITQTLVQDGSHLGVSPTALPQAYSGTVSTRTDNDTGVITLDLTTPTDGHDIITGDRVDLYWTDAAGDKKHRYGMLVGTVDSDTDLTIPVDGGAGDNLPALLFDVVIAICYQEDFVLNGDNCVWLSAQHISAGEAIFNLVNSSNVSQKVMIVEPAVDAYIWTDEGGTTNPVAGLTGIAKVFVSHGDPETAYDVSAAVDAMYS